MQENEYTHPLNFDDDSKKNDEISKLTIPDISKPE